MPMVQSTQTLLHERACILEIVDAFIRDYFFLIISLLFYLSTPSIHPSRRFYYPSTLGGSILIGLNFSRSQAKQSPPPPSVFSDKTKRCCCCIGRCGPTEIKGARNRESAEERSIKNMGNNGKHMAVANFPFLPNKYLSGESARQDKTILDFYFLLLASVDAVWDAVCDEEDHKSTSLSINCIWTTITNDNTGNGSYKTQQEYEMMLLWSLPTFLSCELEFTDRQTVSW